MHRRIDLDRVGSGVSTLSWPGKLVHLTGGTTGQPRTITYDSERYGRSVEVTRQILAAHGVGPKASVVVCQPFDPWAIGGVFRDAALACGARVLPLGLSAGHESLWSTLAAFDPSVFCSSASVLLRLGNALSRAGIGIRRCKRLIFHAGEPLLPTVRAACGNLWRAKVINVYGSAEFDSIASEGLERQGLILTPHLSFALSCGSRGVVELLAPGLDGELLIRSSLDRSWSRSRDRVMVLRSSSREDGLWPESWVVQHLGRVDNVIQLSDGTIVHANSVQALLKSLPIADVQIHAYRSSGLSRLRVLVAPCAGRTSLSTGAVRRVLLKECFELADAIKHGAAALRVEIVGTEALQRTPRGKVATFVEHRST